MAEGLNSPRDRSLLKTAAIPAEDVAPAGNTDLPDDHPPKPAPTSALSRLSTSFYLMLRAQAGESTALDKLFARLLPSLRLWAQYRLPMWARRRLDTGDLVQEAFLHLFRRVKNLEPRRHRALRAYLRESIRHRILDEIRRSALVETSQSGWSDPIDSSASPLDLLTLRETTERYRSALSRLDARDQELIVGRLELGYSYEQLALATGRLSGNAARVAVRRALLRLAAEI